MMEGHVWEKKAGGKKYTHMGWVDDSLELKCNIRYMYELNFLEGKCFCWASPLLDMSTAGIHLRFT